MAQAVFDCDDLKKEIFSYCLPQFPIVTKDMIDRKMKKWKELDIKRTENLLKEYSDRGKNWIRSKRMFFLPCWKADCVLTIEEIKYFQSFEQLKAFAIWKKTKKHQNENTLFLILTQKYYKYLDNYL